MLEYPWEKGSELCATHARGLSPPTPFPSNLPQSLGIIDRAIRVSDTLSILKLGLLRCGKVTSYDTYFRGLCHLLVGEKYRTECPAPRLTHYSMFRHRRSSCSSIVHWRHGQPQVSRPFLDFMILFVAIAIILFHPFLPIGFRV